MKKIISLLLSLTLILGCMLILGSCGGDTETNVIYDVVKNSAPTKTVTLIDYVKTNGDALSDAYYMSVEGNNSIFEYSRERMLHPDEALDYIEEGLPITKYITEEGKIYYKDGKYSEDGETWSAAAPSVTPIKFDLKEEYLTDVTINEDNTVLTAKIAAENIVNVFGVALDVTGTLDITVETNGVNLSKVTLSGTTTSGASIELRTSYTYSPLVLEFPGDAE